MKLYTRSGDDGTTGLFGGDRVPKDHPRIEACGAVDELNAALGLVAAGLAGGDAASRRWRELLPLFQSRLFDLGADLATPPGSPHEDKVVRIDDDDVAALEALIDEVDGANVPMQNFVLPGGTELSARLHLARAVCRRAERRMVTLGGRDAVGTPALIYVNRLGDLLFAMARRSNGAAGVADVPWVKKTNA